MPAHMNTGTNTHLSLHTHTVHTQELLLLKIKKEVRYNFILLLLQCQRDLSYKAGAFLLNQAYLTGYVISIWTLAIISLLASGPAL